MALKTFRFVSLLLVSDPHIWVGVLSRNGDSRQNSTEWHGMVGLQQNLYVTFGVPIGASIEVLAILPTWTLAISVRKRRPALYWTIVAAVCVTAGLAAWFSLVAPINAVLGAADWTSIRNHWESEHAVHAALFGLGFSALVIALLVETPNEPGWCGRSVLKRCGSWHLRWTAEADPRCSPADKEKPR